MKKNTVKWAGLIVAIGALIYKVTCLILFYSTTIHAWNGMLHIYILMYFTSILAILCPLLPNTKAKKCAVAVVTVSVIMLFGDFVLLAIDALSLSFTRMKFYDSGFYPVVNFAHILSGVLVLIECYLREGREFNKAKERYLSNPCMASSLSFWKTENTEIPDGLTVVNDFDYKKMNINGMDTLYFKVKHDLENIKKPVLPDGFRLVNCDISGYSRHIHECYEEENVSVAELSEYRNRKTYAPDLWIAVADESNGQIVATGIAELDKRIGEGNLEWIQVSQGYRRKGLGAFVVNELLYRMKDEASFAVVSGRLGSESNPLALYESCGFKDPVIWHVIKTEENL